MSPSSQCGDFFDEDPGGYDSDESVEEGLKRSRDLCHSR